MTTQSPELPKLRWHTMALIGLLAVWGLWSLANVSYVIGRYGGIFSDNPVVGPVDLFIGLTNPILTICSAYLLSLRSRFSIAAFVALIFMSIFVAIHLHPDLLDPTDHAIDFYYFQSIPAPLRAMALFFLGCVVYGLLLKRNGLLV